MKLSELLNRIENVIDEDPVITQTLHKDVAVWRADQVMKMDKRIVKYSH